MSEMEVKAGKGNQKYPEIKNIYTPGRGSG
jgi:hypothetical protein